VVRIALRSLWSHKSRLLTTFVAVALGVAFIGGVLVLTDTTNKAFDDLFANVYRDTDAVVRSDQKVESDFGPEIRGLIPETLLPVVRDTDGVAVAEGNVDGTARVIDKQGDPVGNPEFGAPTLGGNWTEDDELNPFDLSDGTGPRTDDEIVIDKGTADSTGFEVGDTVTVQTRDKAGKYEVSGIARFGSADSPGGASYVLWTTRAAQELLGEPGKFSSIAVVGDQGVSQPDLARAIRDNLPRDASAQVVTGASITKETQDSIQDALAGPMRFLGIFAAIAVIVGAFVIYNSFSIIVAQRTREMALLRAVGARRRQVRRAVLVEALIVSFVGSLVGFVIGLGIATLLSELFQLPEGSLAILPSSIVVAVVTGVVVTVISALLPAWRASRVPPLAAMREVAVDTTGRSRLRLAIGVVLLVLGVAGVVAGALGDNPARVGLGVALAFLAVLFLAPGLARPVVGALGAPVARIRGVAGQLARDNAARNPRRTASTAAALTIGVGLVTFILVINSSVRASFDKTLDENFRGDFVVSSGTFGMVGLPTTVSRQIAELPDVESVVPIRFAPALVKGEKDGASVTGSNSGIFSLLDLDLLHGTSDLAAGEVVVAEGTADRLGLRVGDKLPLRFLDDARVSTPEQEPPPATVAGIYKAGPTGGIGDFVVGLDDFDAAVPNTTDIQTFVQLKPGVSVAQAQPEIKRVVAPYATAEVQSVDEYKDAIGSQLDIFLALVFGLLALAILIAIIGIANTIALSVLERTRELGLLRAVGMRRRQLRAAVRWESAIISLFGTVLGLSVGLLGGWGIVRALHDDGFQVFQIPFATLILVSVIGVLVGLLAALVPAWRASRLNVLDAINTE
jgi:putative ABC transport system permease protein